MTPVVSARHGDPRVAVLLILAMALIVTPLTAGRKPPPAPALHLAADSTLLLLPDRRETAGQTTPPAESVPLAPRLALFFNRPLPINRAGHATLTMLPGIGPRLADRILSFRIDHGPITSTADLRQINGIGPALAARLAPLLSYR